MKAREVKRKRLVEKYAAREELKKAGDYTALPRNFRNSSKGARAQPLQTPVVRARIHARFRPEQGYVPRNGCIRFIQV